MSETVIICNLFMAYNTRCLNRRTSPFSILYLGLNESNLRSDFNYFLYLSLFHAAINSLLILAENYSHFPLMPLQPSLHDNKDLKHKASERYDM